MISMAFAICIQIHSGNGKFAEHLLQTYILSASRKSISPYHANDNPYYSVVDVRPLGS